MLDSGLAKTSGLPLTLPRVLLPNGTYPLAREGRHLSQEEMISFWQDWASRYPIISLEDPLADSDWEGFSKIIALLGDEVQIVGDDLFVTNRRFHDRGIRKHCCNSI